jgi:hypothetical protein
MAVWTFFSAAQIAKNSPELKIHIRNVAQDTSVYYSVMWKYAYLDTYCHILVPYLLDLLHTWRTPGLSGF